MTTELLEYASHLRSLAADRGFLSESAQVRTKALLTEIADRVPDYNWSYLASRVVRNISAATVELEFIAENHSGEIGKLSQEARSVALLWESLAKLQEATTAQTALVNAAINFEIAGYQANAACIAKQIRPVDDDCPTLLRFTSDFLLRRFVQLSISTKRDLERPDESNFDELSERVAYGLAAKAFSNAARFFLTGQITAFESSQSSFRLAKKLFSSLSLVGEANLVHGIASVLPIMRARSTWQQLGEVISAHPKWLRYVRLLARGTGGNIVQGRSVTEFWPSQIQALDKGLLSLDSNKIIKMPTSAGKTRIAELAVVNSLIGHPGSMCIYVAPYRALVSEVENSFLDLFSDLGFRVSTILGTYESDSFEEVLLDDTDLLITTPEKLDLFLRIKPQLFEKVKLYVLDEVHIVGDQHRGIKYELLISRLKRRFRDARFLTLSAVVPAETLEEFAEWFNAIPKQDILQSEWRPSIQRYAYFEWVKNTGVIRYLNDEGIPGLSQFVPGVIRLQHFEFINAETGRANHKRFPELGNKAQIAAELAFKFAELGPVLVFCTQPDFVRAVANALRERLRLMRLTEQPIPGYFQSSPLRRSTYVAKGNFDESFQEWFDSGIGVHYGSLPDNLRKAIETDFRQKHLRVIVCTNTLAQGVNLPVKTVIFHTVSRWDEDAERRVPIPARDYWNIAGRAGRAGEETEGLVVHIATSPADRRDVNYYYSRRNNVEPVRGALFQKLVDLVENRLTDAGLSAELDPEVMATLVEEDPAEEDVVILDQIIDESLVKVQVRRYFQIEAVDRLKEFMGGVAANISAQAYRKKRYETLLARPG